MLNDRQGENEAVYNQSINNTANESVLIPLANITDTSFHFYTYDSNGTSVRYIVVKDVNGTVHTGFDACNECAPARLGYSQVGDYAKCNNCEKLLPIAGIGTDNINGGCWPGYLPHEIDGDNIFIKKSELDRGKHYFE